MSAQKLIDMVFSEDFGELEEAQNSLVRQESLGRSHLIAKEDLVLSGTELFSACLKRMDPRLKINWHFRNGQFVMESQTIASITGDLTKIIRVERVALNFIRRLSGIATLTRCYVKQVDASQSKIVAASQATPGLRQFENEALEHGLACVEPLTWKERNLIERNQVLLAGGERAAIENARRAGRTPIEVEVTNTEEATEAIDTKVDRIVFTQQMDLVEINTILKRIPATIQTEAMAEFSLEHVRRLAGLGIDYIRVVDLAQSAPCANLRIVLENTLN